MSKDKDKQKPGKGDLAQVKAKELAQRAASGDTGALSALEKIVASFERWKKSIADQKDVGRKAKEIETMAKAEFSNAIECGLPTDAKPVEVLGKLQAVETAYQSEKEATAKAAEMRNDAAEKVKKAASKLERATQDGAQMTLPETGE